MTLKKSTKRFAISTEALNDRGFHVRTEGIDLSMFRKNPLLLWSHQVPTGKDKDEVLPLGEWQDIAVENGAVYGTPAFDVSDPFAEKIYKKVENGTIKMVSAGLIPDQWREVDGKKWLWTSTIAEGSVLARGSNPDALSSNIELMTEDMEVIQLTSDYFRTIFNNDMKTIQLSAEQLKVIGLAADAKPEEQQAKIDEIITLNATQKTQIKTLTTAKKTLEDDKAALETKVEKLEAAEETAKIEQLVSAAVTDGKIVEGDKPKYIKLAAADYDTTEELLNGMPKHEDLGKKFKGSKEDATKLQQLMAKSYQELDKANELVTLKALSLEDFKQKYKDAKGVEYKD